MNIKEKFNEVQSYKDLKQIISELSKAYKLEELQDLICLCVGRYGETATKAYLKCIIFDWLGEKSIAASLIDCDTLTVNKGNK